MIPEGARLTRDQSNVVVIQIGDFLEGAPAFSGKGYDRTPDGHFVLTESAAKALEAFAAVIREMKF